MLTAWDGYARVDYLPEPGRLQITLLTIESTVYRRLRNGLACAFAAEDRAGPPTFVEVDIGTRPTDDARVLLAGQLITVAEGLIGPETSTRPARLRLDELSALAKTWAPYRDWVLAPEPDPRPLRSGSWASGLWTIFSGLGLTAALRALPDPALPGWRSSHETTVDWRDLELPPDLADAAGVDPRVQWVVDQSPSYTGEVVTSVLVRAAGRPSIAARLLVGLDDGQGEWVELAADSPGSPDLIAELPFTPGIDEPTLRFRTDDR
jgi:hypothetical protein